MGKFRETRHPIRGKLVKYFREHPGIHVYPEELSSDLSEPRERILRGMVSMLFYDALPGMVRLQKGGPWMYKPVPEATQETAQNSDKKLFEYVATTKKGDTIIQDEEGTLYRAVELE